MEYLDLIKSMNSDPGNNGSYAVHRTSLASLLHRFFFNRLISKSLVALSSIATMFVLFTLQSCDIENELVGRNKNSDGMAISFLPQDQDQTRSSGDLTTTNISEMSIYAYKSLGNFNATTATSNFMFNQSVTKDAGSGAWTYAPEKFWPSDAYKISFFAISHKPTATNGIVINTTSTTTGYPSLTMTPSLNVTDQTDLCVASVTNSTYTDPDGNGVDNDDTNGLVPLRFKHTLTKVTFSAKYQGTVPPGGSVTIKVLELCGVAGSGTLQFNNTSQTFGWTPDNSKLVSYLVSTKDNTLVNIPLTSTGFTSLSTPTGALQIIPQTTSGARVCMVVAFDNGAFTNEFEVVTTLPAGTWTPGGNIDFNLTLNIDPAGYMNLLPNGTVVDYGYTGNAQTFKAPSSGYYQLEAWGAEGGSSTAAGLHWAINAGGKGGYSSGIVYLKKDQEIYVYVGQKGESFASTLTAKTTYKPWNGGGKAFLSSQPTDANGDRNVGRSGGGATDFRLLQGSNNTEWNKAQSLNSRIIVAGGGGGASAYKFKITIPQSEAGFGGGVFGGHSGAYNYTNPGTGNTSLVYSLGGDQSGPTRLNPFGAGKDGITKYATCGGGGGWYGGLHSASVSDFVSSAGGGSAFISGKEEIREKCIAIDPTSTTDPRTQDPKSGTAKTMTNYNVTVFGPSLTWIDSQEIKVTNAVSISGDSFMPTPEGTNQKGRTGDGYARITKWQ